MSLAFIGDSGCTVQAGRTSINLSGTAVTSPDTHRTHAAALAAADLIDGHYYKWLVEKSDGNVATIRGKFNDAATDNISDITWFDELGTIAATDTVNVKLIGLPFDIGSCIAWMETDGTNQSINSASFTAIHGSTGGGLRTVVSNPFSWWTASSGQFQPTVPGIYKFSAYAVAAGLNSGKRLILSAVKGGSRGDLFRQYSAAAGGYPGGTGMHEWILNGTTDIVELQAYQDNGSAVGVSDAWLKITYEGNVL